MPRRGGIYVQGEVLERVHREGEKNGRKWAFEVLSILTGVNTTEVIWGSQAEGAAPDEGDTVSLLVKGSAGSLSAVRRADTPGLAAVPSQAAKTGS